MFSNSLEWPQTSSNINIRKWPRMTSNSLKCNSSHFISLRPLEATEVIKGPKKIARFARNVIKWDFFSFIPNIVFWTFELNNKEVLEPAFRMKHLSFSISWKMDWGTLIECASSSIEEVERGARSKAKGNWIATRNKKTEIFHASFPPSPPRLHLIMDCNHRHFDLAMMVVTRFVF